MKKARATNSAASRIIRIGTAGWTLPRAHAHHFPETGTHLERCSQTLNCVEINSSFHRPHQLKTWERWARCTPPDFRFSVKLPKAITHTAQLANSGALLQQFFHEVRGLGDKLGPILVQLPPKLAFDESLAHDFFTTLRELHPQHPHSGFIALEPRHASWFTPAVNRLLRSFEIARVAADPPKGSPLGLHTRRLAAASATGVSTASRAPTTPHTTQPSFAASPTSSARPPAHTNGSSSTTPHSATPPATPSPSNTCSRPEPPRPLPSTLYSLPLSPAAAAPSQSATRPARSARRESSASS